MSATAGRPATRVLHIGSQKHQEYWQHNSRDNNITNVNISRDAFNSWDGKNSRDTCNSWDASNSRDARKQISNSRDASNTRDTSTAGLPATLGT
jgi:hypothetical protein